MGRAVWLVGGLWIATALGCSLDHLPYPGYQGGSGHTSQGGAGASTISGGSSATGGSAGCSEDADCLNAGAGPCRKGVCTSGICEIVVVLDGVPDDANPCTEDSCDADGFQQHSPLVGLPCGAPPSCVNGMVHMQSTCDAAGACMPGASLDCAPYACELGVVSCKSACTAATEAEDCQPGASCIGGQCIVILGQGGACASSIECATGQCVDGVCCNTLCAESCKSCNLGGSTPGVCGDLPNGLVDSCAGGEACSNGTCVALGGKMPVGQQCAIGPHCLNSLCVLGLCRLDIGEDCSGAPFAAGCTANLCKDGVCATCAGDADCPSQACHVATGRCLLASGETCGDNADCFIGPCTSHICE